MAKLYPPYIEGTLPAFYVNEKGNGKIVIPFAHNKAVDMGSIGGMVAKVKTVQNDNIVATLIGQYDEANRKVFFSVTNFIVNKSAWKVSVGQFYKLQLAYLDRNGVEGYYSTVGVLKCTSKPVVEIVGFNKDKVNNNTTQFIGKFTQLTGYGDVTEKVFSSEFIISDAKGNVIESTGEILHNVESNPDSYSSIDTMLFNRDLEFGKTYAVQYIVHTNNDLRDEEGNFLSSPRYLLAQQKSLTMELKGTLQAVMNSEEGCVDVSTIGYVNEDGVEEVGNGAFVLAREDLSNPGIWDELYRFTLGYESPTKIVFRDFTIEQGKTYVYAIQQYNTSNIYSDRKRSNSVYADFEDMFLFDGKRQLKLRFNPQVSNFKTQLSETKTETIGRKYPFFYRNAKVGYKTFPVSGLISMLSDDNEFFINKKDILRIDTEMDRHDSLVSKKILPDAYDFKDLRAENYASERLFKLEVLDWLNNGEVKLFKSPGEGNYLVRIMDVSLSPENSLGRMLHNVNSTAYECAECSYNNFIKYGIIESSDLTAQDVDARVETWHEEYMSNYGFSSNINNGEATENLLKSDLEGVSTSILRFTDFLPGTKIKLVFDKSGAYNSENSEIIVIGATGNYFADDIEEVYGIYLLNDLYKDMAIEPKIDEETGQQEQTEKGEPVYQILVDENGRARYTKDPDSPNTTTKEGYTRYNGGAVLSSNGVIGYQYKTSVRNTFDLIKNTETDVGDYAQFVGGEYIQPHNSLLTPKDLLSGLENVREQITKICVAKFHKRPIEYLYYHRNPTEDYYNLEDTIHVRNPATGNYLYSKTGEILDVIEGVYYFQPEVKFRHQYITELEYNEDGSFNKEYYKTLLLSPKYENPNNKHGYRDILNVETACWRDYEIPGGSIEQYQKIIEIEDPVNNPYYETYIAKKPYLGYNMYLADHQLPVLYWDPFDENSRFTDEASKNHSPFAYYVIRDTYVDGVDIAEHIKATTINQIAGNNEELRHQINHLFEKYYIDRYLNAQTAEEYLKEYLALYKRVNSWLFDPQDKSSPNNDEDSALAFEIMKTLPPLMILDAWTGYVYNFSCFSTSGGRLSKEQLIMLYRMYDPNIYINGEPIDISELENYEIENLDREGLKIYVGSGVYGEIFYQKVIKDYQLEDARLNREIANAKENWKSIYNDIKEKLNEYHSVSDKNAVYNWNGEIEQLRWEEKFCYDYDQPLGFIGDFGEIRDDGDSPRDRVVQNTYIHKLKMAIQDWIKRE